jgi:hypothetical protein
MTKRSCRSSKGYQQVLAIAAAIHGPDATAMVDRTNLSDTLWWRCRSVPRWHHARCRQSCRWSEPARRKPPETRNLRNTQMRLNIRNASRQNVQTTSISTLTSFTSGESIDHKAIKRRSLAGEPIRENIPQQEAFLLHRIVQWLVHLRQLHYHARKNIVKQMLRTLLDLLETLCSGCLEIQVPNCIANTFVDRTFSTSTPECLTNSKVPM